MEKKKYLHVILGRKLCLIQGYAKFSDTYTPYHTCPKIKIPNLLPVNASEDWSLMDELQTV